MTARARALALLGAAAAALAALPWGWKASAGVALGVACVGGGMYGTWMLTEVLACAAREGQPKGGWAGPVFVLALKLPLLALGFWGAQRLGPPALSGFWAGLGLVYCATVGWALSQGRKPDQ